MAPLTFCVWPTHRRSKKGRSRRQLPVSSTLVGNSCCRVWPNNAPRFHHVDWSGICIESKTWRKALSIMHVPNQRNHCRWGRRKRGSTPKTNCTTTLNTRSDGIGSLFLLSYALLLCHMSSMRDDCQHLNASIFVNGFSFRSTKSRENRYFTMEYPIPPLNSISNATRTTTTTTLNSDKICVGPLPVVYTNDPRSVSQWIVENIPPGGCTVGFDVEVRDD